MSELKPVKYADGTVLPHHTVPLGIGLKLRRREGNSTEPGRLYEENGVRALAKERDEAYDEISRLRNFVQALYSKEAGRDRAAATCALTNALRKLSPDQAVAEMEGTFKLNDREFYDRILRIEADKAAENFDYEAFGFTYEDDSGWEGCWSSDRVSKTVFVRPLGCYPSIKKTIVVHFRDDVINPVKSVELI